VAELNSNKIETCEKWNGISDGINSGFLRLYILGRQSPSLHREVEVCGSQYGISGGNKIEL